MKSLDIGFIGLGVMGSPMAGHLARAGHSLTLLDANPSAAKQLAQALGGPVRAVRTPREVAEASDIVITMLPNGHAVQTVALGEDGLVHGLRRDAALLDTSSSEPWLTQQTAKTVAERGATMVDAAVSGAEAGAKGAELVFMVGGSDQDVARVRPLLEVMGRSVFHLGPLGSGHAMKCINNCIRHDHRGDRRRPGRRQALRPGSDEDDRRAQPVTGGSWVTRTQFQSVFNRQFDVSFKLALMLKDIGIAVDLAADTSTPVRCGVSGSSCGAWRITPPARGPASARSCDGSRSRQAPS